MFNHILKICIGASTITRYAAKHFIDQGHHNLEKRILKGKYVPREEFENLQDTVFELQHKLSKLGDK